MAMIRVRDFNVDVDIEKEIAEFNWIRARWLPDRLIACSPFRYDSSPSFYVYFHDTATAKAGSWGDSGGSGDYRKGSFVKLLAFLRNESEYETEEYLLSTYAREYTEEDILEVDFSHLRLHTRSQELDKSILDTYEPPSDYLAGRGVSVAVERLFETKYDPEKGAVVIPWFFPDGRLANIKYRHTDSKIFYYHPDGYPIRELIFGLNIVHRFNEKRAILVEAEIDAMYIRSVLGIPAIAVGTSKFPVEKAEAIARSPLEEIIILADNDAAGKVLEEQAIDQLSKYNLRIKKASLPNGYKDANEIKDIKILDNVIKQAKTVTTLMF